MEKDIHFRTVIEVLGKPQKYVEDSLEGYLESLKKSEKYEVIKEQISKAKKQEDEELWAIFAELEVKASTVTDMVDFCFDFMPSLIEIVSPKEFVFKDMELSQFLNDLQAKLHQVDMVAKQTRMENQHLSMNLTGLLKNYVMVLLKKANLTGQELAGLTGVAQDRLEDFLDQLIDEGKIDLKEGIYFLVQKAKEV